jgi:hypothetical protein
MPCTLLRELSPREETTLRRIAQGASLEGLRHDDVVRLEKFGFAETAGGSVTLTPLGVQRLAVMANSRH